MPGKTPPGAEAPFGYTFDTTNQSDSSYPPPGPPLLDNNESSLLDSFFNNPNDINPMFLSLPPDFQSDSFNMFGANPVEWSSEVPAPLGGLAGPTSLLPNSSQQPLHSGPTRQIPPSADVYAAAGILHNNNNANTRLESSSNMDSYGYNMANVGPASAQMNGSGFSGMQNSQASDYDLGEGNNGFYNGYQDTATPYAGLQNRVRGSTRSRPAGPLNFGSDDNFRQNAYAAPAAELPDKQLVDAVDHNFGQDPEASKRPIKDKSSRGQGSSRKRRRQTPPVQAKDEYGSGDADDVRTDIGASFSRRAPSEDDGEDLNTRFNNSAKRGKKKLNPSSAAAAKLDTGLSEHAERADNSALSSPSKKTKMSAASLAKERRENLSEEQKRSNHILSEQKRRNLIKQGFEDLNTMVPELRSSGLSKSNMLVEAARFMRKLREGNEELRLHMESLDNG